LHLGALDEHDVVRAGRLVEGERHVEIAEIESDVGAQTTIADVGVVDPGGRCRVGGVAEIIDEGVVPIVEELAEHADAGAPCVDDIGKRMGPVSCCGWTLR
jgi:hypothetical protein